MHPKSPLFATVLAVGLLLSVAGGTSDARAADKLLLGACRQVTTDGGYHPRFSPDGMRIAYTGGVWPDLHLAVIDAEGGEPTVVPTGRTGDHYLSWRPDGSALTFDAESGSAGVDLYSVELATGVVTRLTTMAGGAFGPHWRADGQRICFASGRTGLGDIYSVDSGGGDLQRHTSAAGTEYYPQWSPDGARIAFARDTGGNVDLWIREISSGAETRWTTDAATDHRPAWSPDGQWLAWTSDRSGADQVYARPVAGGDLVRLTEGHDEASMPHWRGDGAALCYVSGGQIWVVEMTSLLPAEPLTSGGLKAMFRD